MAAVAVSDAADLQLILRMLEEEERNRREQWLHNLRQDEEVARQLNEQLQREQEQQEEGRRRQLLEDEAMARSVTAVIAGSGSASASSSVADDDPATRAVIRDMQEEEERRKLQRLEEEEASAAFADQLNRLFEDERVAAEVARTLAQEDAATWGQQMVDDAKLAAEVQQQWQESEAQAAAQAERKEHEAQASREVAHLAAGPGYWTEPLGPGEPYRRVKIASDSGLYKLVMQRFAACQRTVIGVEYVQNAKVWERYHAAKTALKSGDAIRFHGTPAVNIDGICKHGLLIAKDQVRRGTTIWTAQAPDYSVGYSQKGPAADGSLYMFYCRVLTSMPAAAITTVSASEHVFPEFLIHYK